MQRRGNRQDHRYTNDGHSSHHTQRWQHDQYSTREHDDRNPGGRGYGSSHDEPDYRPYQEQPRHQPDYAPHFDSGGYDRSLIRFPSPPSTSSAGGYAGQDYREYADQAPAARPDRPRRRPNTAPNNSVILIGLPQMATEDDVRSFIDEFKAHPDDPSAVENATIVIDKQTGQSKRFGFVRFISLEHARGASSTLSYAISLLT